MCFLKKQFRHLVEDGGSGNIAKKLNLMRFLKHFCVYLEPAQFVKWVLTILSGVEFLRILSRSRKKKENLPCVHVLNKRLIMKFHVVVVQ